MESLFNRLKWRHLRLILAIHQSGQLSVAAQQLAITQPAASRMLAEIEKLIGHPLFDRNPRGMTPTTIGTVLIRHADSLLQGLSATAKEVGAFSEGKSGSVSVGSITDAAVAYVVPAIIALKRQASGAEVSIAVAPSEVLIPGLLNGEHDFVLSRIPPEHDARQFHVLSGRVEEVDFLVHAEHPLASIESPTIEDLSGFNWVIQALGSPMRQAVEDAFFSWGVPLPSEIVNTPSLLVMIAYLRSSCAISPISSKVSDLLMDSGMTGLAVVRIRQSIIISPYHLVQKKGRIINPLAKRLSDLVINGLSQHSN